MKRLLRAPLLALGLLASACGPDIEDVCDRLVDLCPDLIRDECQDDAERLRDLAGIHDCTDRFDDYLACVDTITSCDREDRCALERQVLEACTGAFPP